MSSALQNIMEEVGPALQAAERNGGTLGHRSEMFSRKRAGECRYLGSIKERVPTAHLSCKCNTQNANLRECAFFDEWVLRNPIVGVDTSKDIHRLLSYRFPEFLGRTCMNCEEYKEVPPASKPGQIGNRFLPRVTLACVDCVRPEMALKVLLLSCTKIRFGRVLLITHKKIKVPAWVDLVVLSNKLSFNGYNRFMLTRMHSYIDTPYLLSIQEDGWVHRPELWRDDWFEFDYIGAPWSGGRRRMATYTRVGNSGVCLRSHHFLKLTSQFATEDLLKGHRDSHRGKIYDDVFACNDIYGPLTRAGIEFAPVDEAEQFCFDSLAGQTKQFNSPTDSFAFHGFNHPYCKKMANKLPSIKVSKSPAYKDYDYHDLSR